MEKQAYIESSAPGKTWEIHATKNRQGFVTGTAIEGDYVQASEGCPFNSFTYVMFQSRQESVPTTAKRATAKAEGEAILAITQKLKDLGYVKG